MKNITDNHFLNSPYKPTSVLAILIHHVSSKAYNLNLDRRMPAMLLPNPHKTVLPKLGFFQAIILMKSLGNQVVHAFGFLADFLNSYGMNTKSVLFLQYDGIPGKKIVVRIHSSASVTFLQNHSTPHHSIAGWLTLDLSLHIHFCDGTTRQSQQMLHLLNPSTLSSFVCPRLLPLY